MESTRRGFSDIFRSSTAEIPDLLERIHHYLPFKAVVGPRFDDRQITVVCMTPRSGSGYLGSILRENGFGPTREHFRIVGGALERDAAKIKRKSYEEYFRNKVQQRTENRNFTVKLGWPQFAPIYYSGVFSFYLRDATYIYLTREDIISQAISRYIANETGYFHTPDKGDSQNDLVHFDYNGIRKHLEFLVEMQGDWERFFASEGLSPVRITYEQVASNPTAAFAKIAEAAGSPMPETIITQTEFGVTRTSKNAHLREAFIEEHRRRMHNGVVKFINANSENTG
ncbi:Stf0 family sulfotransferase [Acuticoccus mangrovi]|uniref:Sulphotransferase Stf0 domain-containing protein n=1 Tax=Acuticoccus mangrovi TaxID=2796142 RepID=A0A934IHS2_9HYPH|nr:Stf0 family sulfotransferase [Acuticoccus mangrovi]MBJ3776703.1 hypothetical protein [Acuticoccus mangrovi]